MKGLSLCWSLTSEKAVVEGSEVLVVDCYLFLTPCSRHA